MEEAEAPVAPLVVAVVFVVASLTVTVYVPAVVDVLEVRVPLLTEKDPKSVPEVIVVPFFLMDEMLQVTLEGPADLLNVMESECPAKELSVVEPLMATLSSTTTVTVRVAEDPPVAAVARYDSLKTYVPDADGVPDTAPVLAAMVIPLYAVPGVTVAADPSLVASRVIEDSVVPVGMLTPGTDIAVSPLMAYTDRKSTRLNSSHGY